MVLDNGNSGKKRSMFVVVLTLIAVSVLVGSAFGEYTPIPDGVYNNDGTPYNSNESNSYNVFQNPTFGSSFDGWIVDSRGAGTDVAGSNTAYSTYANSQVSSKNTANAGWASLNQTIDVTYVNEITFDISLAAYSALGTGVDFGKIYVGGNVASYTIDSGTTKYNYLSSAAIFGKSPTTNKYHTLHIDTSSLTGRVQFEVHFKVYAVTNEYGEFVDEFGNVVESDDENGTFTWLSLNTTNYSGINPYELPRINSVSSYILETNQDTSEYLVNKNTLNSPTVRFSVAFSIGYPATTYVGYVSTSSSEYVPTSDDVYNWNKVTTSPCTFDVVLGDGFNYFYVWVKNDYGASSNYGLRGIECLSIGVTATTASSITPPIKIQQGGTVNLLTTGNTTNIHEDTSTPVWYVRPSGGDWTQVYIGKSSTPWYVNGSSLYDIKISGQTESGRKFTVDSTTAYPNGIINSVAAYIKFTNTSYTTSQTAKVEWDLGLEYQTGHSYSLYIFSCPDNTGLQPSLPSHFTKENIPSSGYVEMLCTGFPSGYVGAYIHDMTVDPYNALIQTRGVAITVIGNLKFTITNNGATWTQPTTFTLYDANGENVVTGLSPSNPITNVTSGECTYSNVVSPNRFVIKAVTEGYNITYPLYFEIDTGGLTETIPLDFTNGGGSSETVGGSGSMYASSYVTFRVIDSGTGGYVEGVHVSGYAESATNPVEWIGNLFGQTWGGKIQGSTVSGTTDKDGKITFAMFPVYKYRLTLQYLDKTWNYSFTPTELTTEEIISLPISDAISKETATQLVVTAVEPDNSSGKINIYYEDISNNGAGSTEKVVIRVFSIDENGEKKPIILDKAKESTEMVISGMQKFDPPISLQMEKWQRNSFWVEMDCYVGAFYPSVDHSKPSVSRSGGVTFSGMRIQIGSIPEGFYLIISFGILVMLGAIGTQVTSRFYAIIVAAVGLFLWWAGWMSALGIVGEIACVLAFVLAILYYIAGVNQPQ